VPAIVGPIRIEDVQSTGMASVGDVFAISPKSSTQSSGGSGAFSIGDYNWLMNQKNKTKFEDADIFDQNELFDF
jgi:spore germination protein PF